MSGIASAAPTMPGSVATFCSCSSELSREIASSSSASAKTRAGTRMSPRADAEISQSVSSTRRSSDIENDACSPATAFLLELEPMVGHGLHQRRRLGRDAVDGGRQARVADRQLPNPFRHEPERVRREDEVLEPLDEQRRPVTRVEADLQLERLAAVAPDELRERGR